LYCANAAFTESATRLRGSHACRDSHAAGFFRVHLWPGPFRQKGPTCIPTAGRDLGRRLILCIAPTRHSQKVRLDFAVCVLILFDRRQPAIAIAFAFGGRVGFAAFPDLFAVELGDDLGAGHLHEPEVPAFVFLIV
jgi:hypothetical protein